MDDTCCDHRLIGILLSDVGRGRVSDSPMALSFALQEEAVALDDYCQCVELWADDLDDDLVGGGWGDVLRACGTIRHQTYSTRSVISLGSITSQIYRT